MIIRLANEEIGQQLVVDREAVDLDRSRRYTYRAHVEEMYDLGVTDLGISQPKAP